MTCTNSITYNIYELRMAAESFNLLLFIFLANVCEFVKFIEVH